MTELEWLTSVTALPMLEYLRGKVSDRKLRLIACACCRRVWDCFKEEKVPSEVALSERYAECQASKRELKAARSRLGARGGYSAAWAASNALGAILDNVAHRAASNAAQSSIEFRIFLAMEKPNSDRLHARAASSVEHQKQTGLVKEIVGNPFQSITIDSVWLTATSRTVPKVARTIYDERAFDRLPILADALEDAGCDNTAILDHCRSGGEHARGCWVLDLLLGKK
jgi:hypothetical protein